MKQNQRRKRVRYIDVTGARDARFSSISVDVMHVRYTLMFFYSINLENRKIPVKPPINAFSNKRPSVHNMFDIFHVSGYISAKNGPTFIP